MHDAVHRLFRLREVWRVQVRLVPRDDVLRCLHFWVKVKVVHAELAFVHVARNAAL